MPILKREIFLRPNRMTHRFGEQTDGNDPFGSGTFDLKSPTGKIHSTSTPEGRTGIKQNGVAKYYEATFPIAKAKGGDASLSGPTPDYAAAEAIRPPVSTARRKVTAGAK